MTQAERIIDEYLHGGKTFSPTEAARKVDGVQVSENRWQYWSRCFTFPDGSVLRTRGRGRAFSYEVL